jgi:hypothetical protein
LYSFLFSPILATHPAHRSLYHSTVLIILGDMHISRSSLCNIKKSLTHFILLKAKGKVKNIKLPLCLIKHHVTKTYWGSGAIAPCIHDLGTRR